MSLSSNLAREENSLNTQPSKREDLLLVAANRRRDKLANYQNMRVEVLRALMVVLQQEMEALPEHLALDNPEELKLSEVVRRIEARLIHAALVRTGGRRRRAARLLGVKVPTLIAKIKRFNINLLEVINSNQKK